MEIQLRPELEDLIREDVQRGFYRSVDEFLERAVTLLHEQETWLAANRGEISARIEEGWLAAERGEVADSEQVQARMRERKEAWIKQHRPA